MKYLLPTLLLIVIHSFRCDTTNDSRPSLETPEMVLIPAQDSSFQMGSDFYGPIHEVQFTYNYFMFATEVTQGEYDAVMSNTSFPDTSYGDGKFWDDEGGVGSEFPAYNVNWYDAILYCNARSKLDGLDTVYSYSSIYGLPGSGCTLYDIVITLSNKGYRLPTEAEWEYACKAGKDRDFYWNSNFENADYYICYNLNSDSQEVVGGKLPNDFGLYDMIGNVEEWCNDRWAGYNDTGESEIDPTGDSTSTQRVVRGGNYLNDEEDDLSSITRDHSRPSHTGDYKGFRCVLNENIPTSWR